MLTLKQRKLQHKMGNQKMSSFPLLYRGREQKKKDRKKVLIYHKHVVPL